MGGPRKVTDAWQSELEAAVEQEPREVGKPFSVWTCRDLVQHLADKVQVAVSSETVRRHLHRRDYRVLRPVLSVTSHDPDYDAKAERLQQYRQQARDGQIVLLYEDEVDLNLLPAVVRCWTKRGQQRKIATPGQNHKRYGFGAVDFITGQFTHCIAERKNSDGFCRLVEQIVTDYCPGDSWSGRPVVLVVDNYIIHRSHKTQAVLDRYADRLTVVSLPTYSPKLNPIELLWKYMRRRVTHNHLFPSISALVNAVDGFFTDLGCQPALVLSVIGNPP